MKKFGRKHQKQLAKLVAVALICAGGELLSPPSVASAEEVKEVTWDGSLTGSTPTNVTPDNAAMRLSGIGNLYAHITDTYVTQGYKTVTLIPSGTTLYVMSGYNSTTDALSGFTLNINDGFWNSVYGAFSQKGGNVTGNKVYVKGGTVREVYGGSANVMGNVKDNEAYIEDGTVTNRNSGESSNIYGGNSVNGNSEHNTVTINGGTISSDVFGGKSLHGAANNNNVNILGGSTTFNRIYGGYGDATSNNHVNIGKGSTLRYGYGSAIFGGYGTGDVEINTVTISGTLDGGVGVDVYGGVTGGNGKSVKNNSVTITGNAAFNIADENDNVFIHGGWASATGANATENTVTISGNSTFGKAHLIIYGGSSTAAANNNTVIIDGGTVNGTIYGGNASGISGDTEASGNTVTIEKDATLGSETCISGGHAAKMVISRGSGFSQVPCTTNNNTVNILKAITIKHIVGGSNATEGKGNTLNINAIGVTVGDYGVTGFQNMNFFLADGAAGKTMLTVNVKDASGNGAATNLTGVTIGAAVQAGANFNKGDTVNLITNPSGLTTDGTTTMKQITDETVTIQTKPTAKTLTTDQSYKLEVSQKDENTIIATITDTEEKQNGECAKSLVETRAATTTFVNAGADMLASQGFAQAANAVALDMAENVKNGTPGVQSVGGFTPFAAVGGSSMRAESGSYVDTKGFGLNIGFARELPNAQGKLLFGPVVEYGGGSYDSHLDDGTRGEGKAHYVGVGVMARQVNNDGFYYEGSLRGGRVTSDYKGDLDSIGRVDYDSSSNYFAAHLGVGKAFALGNGNTLDGYCKYFYSHQAGDDTTVHIAGMADERGHFDAVDSHRIRIGARLTHKVNERNSYYGGLAYQYEFKGDARATFSGNGVPSPNLKGSSGLLELGWQVKPGEGPLKLDLGVTGWAGKQRGGNVQLGATWTF